MQTVRFEMLKMTYSKIQNILPGLGLSVAVAIAAIGLEKVEEHYAGRAGSKRW